MKQVGPLFTRILFVLLVFTAAQAQDSGRYILELEDPAATPLKSQTRAAVAERRAQLRLQHALMRESLEEQRVEVLDTVENVVNAIIVNAPSLAAADLARIPGVRRVHAVRRYKLLLDHAIPLHQISEAWNQVGGASGAGAGIKIAIIDTGIDITHPGFRDASLPLLPDFPRVNRDTDLRYTNSKVIVARSYNRGDMGNANDVIGHGTSVAMAAAGVTNTGPFGPITGVAPRAWLGSYKVFPERTGGAPNDLILKAIDDAVSDGMDVINLSLGEFPAERPDNDLIVQAVDRAGAAGIVVVTAAGNEGPGLNTIGSPATASSVIAVGNSNNDRMFASVAAINGKNYAIIAGSASKSQRPITARIKDVASLDPSGLACSELPAASLTGQIVLILRGVCFFEDKLNNVQRAGAVAALVYTDPETPDPFTMEVGNARLPSAMVAHADGVEIKSALAAGSDASMTLNFSLAPVGLNPFRLNPSSSRGPVSNGAAKPELLAVGTSVYTAGLPSTDGLPGYSIVSGTSLSSPVIAGAAALLKAARPGLDRTHYRSLLVNSSTRFPGDSGDPGPVQQGAGSLNMMSAVRGTVVANPVTLGFGVGGGTADISRPLTITNIGKTADTFSILVASSNGTSAAVSENVVALDRGQSREIAVRFQGEGLAPGEYQGFLLVRGTQSDIEARIPYWYGVPSNRASEILVFEPPATATVNSRNQLIFRALDSSGIPVGGDPVVTASSGGGSVLSARSIDDSYPGWYLANVRVGAETGDNVFEIEFGGSKTTVTIKATAAP